MPSSFFSRTKPSAAALRASAACSASHAWGAGSGVPGLNNYSVYGSYDRKLSRATNIIFSAREDLIRSEAGDYNEFLPQIQAITKFDEHNSVYASVGKSFRMPTFRNLYYASSVVVPNPDLEAEHGWNYEIGYKYSENGRRLNLTAFRIDIKDQIVDQDVQLYLHQLEH